MLPVHPNLQLTFELGIGKASALSLQSRHISTAPVNKTSESRHVLSKALEIYEVDTFYQQNALLGPC